MPSPRRGELWPVDLGMTAKVRPALVVSVPAEDQDRALVTLVPHAKLIRSLGVLSAAQFAVVERAVRLWLGIQPTDTR